MSLYTYTIEQSNEWDKVVKSFKLYDVYYLSGYVKAFVIHGDGDPLLFYYENDSVRGINVVMKRDISDISCFSGKIEKNTLFDFATPYGYGGWLIEGDGDITPLLLEYEKWCVEHNIVSEFVRYHPIINNANDTKSFYDVLPLGKTISMDLSSPEIIWANLTSKNRNMIRKAQKAGIKIFRGNLPENYAVFKEIYDLTMLSDDARPYYFFNNEFYESIRNDLSEKGQTFWAELDGKIIASSIMISVNGYMNYHLSGSLRNYQHLAPTNLLLYEAALWGSKNGYKSFHLGGGVGSKEDGLYKFKCAFNRSETNQFAIGRKIYLKDVYDELSELNNSGAEGTFFPKYRA